MALMHTGVQCELREVMLNDKPASMLKISPKGTVPVLILPDGRVIDESLDVMRWALAGNDWLRGNAVEMTALIVHNDDVFKQHLDRYKYPQRFEGIDSTAHFQAACVVLEQLEARLLRSRFLFGDVVCWADVAIFPFVRQFAAVDQQAFAALPLAALQSWLAQWLAGHCFQSTMLKRQPWHVGDEPVFLF